MRQNCVGQFAAMLFLLVALWSSMALARGVDDAGDGDLERRANQTMGLKASRVSSVLIDAGENGIQRVDTTIDGRAETLVLEPAGVRADGYRLIAQVADGSYIDVEPGTDRHFTGYIDGRGGTSVAATMTADGVFARIHLADGRSMWMEPAAVHLAGAPEYERRADRRTLHVSYHTEDVIGCAGDCGVPTRADDAMIHAVAASTDAAVVGGLCVARVACDADFEFFTNHGSVEDVESRILSIINAMNLQYNAEVGITHQVSAIIVRTAEPDPFISTSSSTLIAQFKDHWNAQQSAVSRDVAHLFTGKNLDGSTIGLAYQVNDSGVICNQVSGYSLVQSDFSGLFSCVTDLSAHEIGHNWGANHCTASCNSTMNSSIQCANTFAGSAPDSIAVITDFRDTANCLDCGDLLTLDLTLNGEGTTSRFAKSVAVLDDVNGDGEKDYLVGAPDNDEAGTNAGKVYVLSGANSGLLWSKLGQAAGDRFGTAVAALRDRALVGAPYNDTTGADAGRVYVYGPTGTQLKVRNGQDAGDRFGWALDGNGDINSDGTNDFLVGAPYRDVPGNDAGAVYVYDGVTYDQLKRLQGEAAGDKFGWSLAIVGNFNLDGFADFIVGAPYNDNAGGANAGEVYLYSGSTFTKFAVKRGAAAGDQYGRAVAALGRVNSDSLDDFAVGAPYYDLGGDANVGRVYVYSGSAFGQLWAVNGTAAGDLFGSAIASAGDINGDDRFDVIIGAPMNDAAGANAGRVTVRSALNGAAVQTFNGTAAGDQLGGSLAGGGGLNEPLPARIIIGASLNDAAGANAGRAFAYTGLTSGLDAAMMPARPTIKTCLADVAGFDGVVDQDDLLAVLQNWAQCPSIPRDISSATSSFESEESGCGLDISDIAAVLGAWGPCPR